MKKIALIVSCLTALTLSSCSSPRTLYSWYKYEDTSYQYSKAQTDELQEELLQQYARMQAKQRGLRRTVPPGLCAEQGFLLCKQGKTNEGIALLKQEIELYPESSVFISRIIKQLEK